jgi:hypothetical protein
LDKALKDPSGLKKKKNPLDWISSRSNRVEEKSSR